MAIRNLILQPVASSSAKEHFKNTIETKVPVSVIEKAEPSAKKYLDIDCFDGKVCVWGITNATAGARRKDFLRMFRGDLILFSRDGEIFAYGTLLYKFNNALLAKTLWGLDENGKPWENIYLIKDYHEFHIPYSEFNDCMGYKSNFVIQGFTVLDYNKASRFFAKYNI